MIQKLHKSRFCVLLTLVVPVPKPAVRAQWGLNHRFLEERMSFEYTDTLLTIGYAIQHEVRAPPQKNFGAATARTCLFLLLI